MFWLYLFSVHGTALSLNFVECSHYCLLCVYVCAQARACDVFPIEIIVDLLARCDTEKFFAYFSHFSSVIRFCKTIFKMPQSGY